MAEDPDLQRYLDTLKKQGVQITPRVIALWNKRKIEPAKEQPLQVSIKRPGAEDHIVTVVDV